MSNSRAVGRLPTAFPNQPGNNHEAIEYCKAKNAKEIFTAVLLDKTKKRKPGGVEQADFKALTIEDKFVYGYGLDYSEYLRNAPGIYAVTV